MHHTFLSLLLPTALCAAALSLGAPAQAATPLPAPPMAASGTAALSAAVALAPHAAPLRYCRPRGARAKVPALLRGENGR